MKKKTFGINLGIIVGLNLIMVLTAVDASAWGGYRGGRYHYNHGFHNGYYHNYFGWEFHRPYWYDYGPIAPSLGGFVAYLPDGYTTLFVGGTPYYFCGGYYFRPYSSGYVIVPAPAVATAAPAPQSQNTSSGAQQQTSSVTTDQTSSSSEQQKSLNTAAEEPRTPAGISVQSKPASKDTTTINIPNSKGGFTPVKLVKQKDGYLGPQGEFYAGHPTVDQLKALYGN
jgi:hypothetical protein